MTTATLSRWVPAFAWLALAPFCSGSVLYTITDLGLLTDGTFNSPSSINSTGRITGGADTTGGASRAFVWNTGLLQEIGTLAGYPDSYGAGINAAGQVAGYSADVGMIRAFFWNGTTMTDLGVVGGFANSAGTGVNASGQVVGALSGGAMSGRGFFWDGVTMVLLNGTFGQANAINDSGQIAGSDNGVAVVWANSAATATQLGVLSGWDTSEATSINASGQVAGNNYLNATGESLAFFWNGTALSALNPLSGDTNSAATGVNSAGDAVGYSIGAGLRAVLWQNGTPVDLGTVLQNGAGWTLEAANAINASGQIVGTGFLNGQARGFLLTPVSAVPEPTTFAIVAAGLLWVGVRRGTRR